MTMRPWLAKSAGHDVSGEARDDHGRWTTGAGGGSESKPATVIKYTLSRRAAREMMDGFSREGWGKPDPKVRGSGIATQPTRWLTGTNLYISPKGGIGEQEGVSYSDGAFLVTAMTSGTRGTELPKTFRTFEAAAAYAEGHYAKQVDQGYAPKPSDGPLVGVYERAKERGLEGIPESERDKPRLPNGKLIPDGHTACPKCAGHGQIGEYGHVAGGVCFKCNGSGLMKVGKSKAARPWLSKGFGRFDPSKHPRNHGKFASTGGGVSRHNPDLDAAMGSAPHTPKAPSADIRAHGPDIFAEHGEPARHPSAHNPAITYGHAEDRDSDDKHFTRTIRSANKEVDRIRGELAKLEAQRPTADPSKLHVINAKIAGLKAEHAAHGENIRKLRAEMTASKVNQRTAAGMRGKPSSRPIPMEGAAPTSPDLFAEHQTGTGPMAPGQRPGPPPLPGKPPGAQPPALPHHRTQASALEAARQVKPGDHASHAAAVQALTAHYHEGKKALQRMAAERHGEGSFKARRAYATALQAWRGKMTAARGKIDQLAGRGPPPVPSAGGPRGTFGTAEHFEEFATGRRGPPPLANRGKVDPWVSMSGGSKPARATFGTQEHFDEFTFGRRRGKSLNDLAALTDVDWVPWVTKGGHDVSGEPRDEAGRWVAEHLGSARTRQAFRAAVGDVKAKLVSAADERKTAALKQALDGNEYLSDEQREIAARVLSRAWDRAHRAWLQTVEEEIESADGRTAKLQAAEEFAGSHAGEFEIDATTDELRDALIESADLPEDDADADRHASDWHVEARSIVRRFARAAGVDKAARPWLSKRWNPADHPRGQPENAGEFGPGGGKAKPAAGKSAPASANNQTEKATVGDEHLAKVRAKALAKWKAAIKPTAAERKQNVRGMKAVGAADFEMKSRGNSKDRRASRLKLAAEFGDGQKCACIYCGLIVHAIPTEDQPGLERDKMFTAAQGGKYRHHNLVPACRDCNLDRLDTPFEEYFHASHGKDVGRAGPRAAGSGSGGGTDDPQAADSRPVPHQRPAGRSEKRPGSARKGYDGARPWLVTKRAGHDVSGEARDHGQFARTPGSNGTATTVSPDKSHSKARRLAQRIGEVPDQLRTRAAGFVRGRYRKLSSRYGPKGAGAILAATVLLLPSPVPGSSLLPIAVAEAVLRLRRAVGKAYDPDLDDATIQREAKRLIRDLYDHCGETL